MNKLRFMLCLSLASAGVLYAEDPVTFGDPTLKAAVENELWVTDPTPTDMLGLTSLEAGSLEITSVTGLEYAKNLQKLYLRLNYVTDVSPLSGLTELEYLVLHRNPVTDLSPLSGLTKLYHLNIDGTGTSDISALAGLTNLSNLDMFNNRVSDISPLLGLMALTELDLRMNPLNEEAYTVHIPQIIADNPGIHIKHDRGPYQLVFSSTAGGSIIYPGEGEFTSNDGKPVYVEAKANPGFAFAGFSGSYSSSANPFSFMPGSDGQIRADFLSASDTLYVDDDATGDPGPNNANVSDPGENGTPTHPFDRIQEAIEVAADGATIIVRAGTYPEAIDLLGKDITLTGFDPNDPNASAWPIIQGTSGKPIVSFTGAGQTHCLLQGFVLTGGSGRLAGAIQCSGARPTLSNCLLVGNRTTSWEGSIIRCTDSNAVVVNCTIADNYAGLAGAAIDLHNSDLTVVNSILRGNVPREIQSDGLGTLSVRYSAIAGDWPGQGNMDVDPLFVACGFWSDRNGLGEIRRPDDPDAIWVMGDYHLQSQGGRWDGQTGQWVSDGATSPCIDAGDPVSPAGREPAPNGEIINLGAYGGTAEASMSFP
jgi:hypothetical protein